MKCEKIDFIGYVEGVSPKEVMTHIADCKRCQKEAEKFLNFSKLISSRYIQGKKADEELEARLKSIDCEEMESLPFFLQKKVLELKEKSLTFRVKKVLGKAKQKEASLVESLFRPHLQVVPASPKDITKVKKKGTRKKKKQ